MKNANSEINDLTVTPTTLKQAQQFIAAHHRHHQPPHGHKFAVSVVDSATGQMVGVAVAGLPVARNNDDGRTLEITRVCVLDGVPNGCSKMIGALRKAGAALGFRRFISYTLDTEPGTSYRAAGFRCDRVTSGDTWDRPGRKREIKSPTGPKKRWVWP